MKTKMVTNSWGVPTTVPASFAKKLKLKKPEYIYDAKGNVLGIKGVFSSH